MRFHSWVARASLAGVPVFMSWQDYLGLPFPCLFPPQFPSDLGIQRGRDFQVLQSPTECVWTFYLEGDDSMELVVYQNEVWSVGYAVAESKTDSLWNQIEAGNILVVLLELSLQLVEQWLGALANAFLGYSQRDFLSLGTDLPQLLQHLVSPSHSPGNVFRSDAHESKLNGYDLVFSYVLQR